MAAHSTGRSPFAWTEKKFHEDVLPYKRQLAAALQEVCRHLVVKTPEGLTLTHPTQAQAATYLHVSETTLTRYLYGQRVPPQGGAIAIFDRACRDAGGSQNVAVTRERLLELRRRAEQERCANCSRHSDAVRAATHKLRELQETNAQLERSAAEQAQELGELRQHAAALRQEARREKTAEPVPASEAGPQMVRGTSRLATLLPVPPHQADRQHVKNGASPTRNVGRRAEELLHGGRPDSTLALLRHTAEAYTPSEVALLVALLRVQGQHELTDNLVHIYARDRDDQDVVRAALVLHEQQAVADAEALLRTAASHPGPAGSRG
ncbi:hypothetical protein KVH24_12055 [Streptomyces olivaceus]|uniref:hypothetical protein n=1 Tax=Streptomyces olivaceus TaxID=47716 RepID=UPI001CCF1FD6|nr:hypothetical protein [Streptomyces olivaceus]MBZ6173353.1 hypothetical protein [Streptomyces olivaceus]MBZ6179732.1 hypothetical protein [Streptomyces olivaceus]